jgi:hypothetical protein
LVNKRYARTVPALTRPEAATLALYELGGADNTVDTEDIAVQLESLAPGMFVWQKYRDRIDKELVRVALSDARLKAGYVVGSHSKGWMLTAAGVDFGKRRSEGRAPGVPQRTTREDAQWAKERARLLNTAAYSRLASGEAEDITPDEADAFFRLNVYIRGESRDKKIVRLENQFGNDPEVGPLVRLLAPLARERI